MKPWDQYAHDVVDGSIVASKWVRLACKRHLDDLEDGHLRGIYFDEVDANRFIQFFEQFLSHTKGKWAGQPFLLLPWQKSLQLPASSVGSSKTDRGDSQPCIAKSDGRMAKPNCWRA